MSTDIDAYIKNGGQVVQLKHGETYAKGNCYQKGDIVSMHEVNKIKQWCLEKSNRFEDLAEAIGNSKSQIWRIVNFLSRCTNKKYRNLKKGMAEVEKAEALEEKPQSDPIA